MTHEYDDPIDPEQLTQAVRHIAERYRAEDCELNDLIEEVVDERFCGRRCQVIEGWASRSPNLEFHAAASDTVSHSVIAAVRKYRIIVLEMRCRWILKLL